MDVFHFNSISFHSSLSCLRFISNRLVFISESFSYAVWISTNLNKKKYMWLKFQQNWMIEIILQFGPKNIYTYLSLASCFSSSFWYLSGCHFLLSSRYRLLISPCVAPFFSSNTYNDQNDCTHCIWNKNHVCEVSQNAGEYICNYMYYRIQERQAQIR